MVDAVKVNVRWSINKEVVCGVLVTRGEMLCYLLIDGLCKMHFSPFNAM